MCRIGLCRNDVLPKESVGARTSQEGLALELADDCPVGARGVGGAQAQPTPVEPMDTNACKEKGTEGSAPAETSGPLQEKRRRAGRSGAARKRAWKSRQALLALSEQGRSDQSAAGNCGAAPVEPHGTTGSSLVEGENTAMGGRLDGVLSGPGWQTQPHRRLAKP